MICAVGRFFFETGAARGKEKRADSAFAGGWREKKEKEMRKKDQSKKPALIP